MPTTPRGLPYPSASDPVAQGAAAIQALAVAVDPLLSIVSATPPASPVDGMLWSLPVSATLGIVWVFRYRAASASAFKWEFVGGAPWTVTITTSETSGSTAWGDLPTAGPTVSPLPRAGEYLVKGTVVLTNNTANAQSMFSFLLGANPIQQLGQHQAYVAGAAATVSSARWLAVAAANDPVRLMYAVTAGIGTFLNRHIEVLPRRVS